MRLPHQQGDLIIRDALTPFIKTADKEDKANSKADETVVLVGLALWQPTRALVIKALLVRETSEL
jgi:hypothetical protein